MPLVPSGTEVLAGLEMGGIPIVTMLSQVTGLPCAFIRKEAKPFSAQVAGCFDTSPKPVGATFALKFDARGTPSRIKVAADQPAFNLEDCVAAALLELRGPPNATGTLEMLRFH